MVMLHPQLDKDGVYLGKFDLCHLLLMNASQYPWCILVTDGDNVQEIYQLSDNEQQRLICKSSQLAEGMMTLFKGGQDEHRGPG